MKIDFKEDYKRLSALVQTPVKPREEGANRPSFSSLLGSVGPEKASLNDKMGERSEPAPSVPTLQPQRMPMARFRFPEPESQLSIPKVISQPEGPAPQIESVAPSVKTPTLLSIKRVSANGTIEQGSVAPVTPRQQNAAPSTSGLRSVVMDAGRKNGIDPALGLAVAQVESAFQPRAQSVDGFSSKGLFQLLDTTGKHLLAKSGSAEQYDPFNPQQNAELGTSYLRHLHEIFSRSSEVSRGLSTEAAANSSSLEKLAVAAFNAGEGRVAHAQKRAKSAGKDPANYADVQAYLPESTQNYVKRVLSVRTSLEADFIS